MHLYLLENPTAGRGRTPSFLAEFTRALLAAGHEVTRYRGETRGDLVRHVGALAEHELDLLGVVGGDGTLRTVLGARPAPFPWPVVVLPFGTANLAAREARTFPLREPKAMVEALVTGDAWPVDLLEIHRPPGTQGSDTRDLAITNVSAGVDGALVHAVTEVRQRHGGRGGYDKWVGPLLGVLRDRARVRVAVEVDDRAPIEGTDVIVQNAGNYGGLFRLAPDARLDSHRLEVVVFGGTTARDLLRFGMRAGLRTAHRDRQVRILGGHRVRLSAVQPVPVQADGDPAGTTDLEVRVVPSALRLLRVRS